MKIHRNEKQGIQIEHEELLITIGLNEHYGISGTVNMIKGNKMVVLTFHGREPGVPFPVEAHVEVTGRPKDN